jgi:hypothetical protein
MVLDKTPAIECRKQRQRKRTYEYNHKGLERAGDLKMRKGDAAPLIGIS